MTIPMLAAIVVTAAFEGGSVGRVEQAGPRHLVCAVKGQADQNGRNRQANWYYFRMDGLPRGEEVRVDFTDLVGEYNFRPGSHAVTKNSRPVFSYDRKTWTHFADGQASWDEKEIRLTIRFRPERSRMWIAHMEPYTREHLSRLMGLNRPHLHLEAAGLTVRGNEIPMLTITDPAVADSGKKVIWLMARQHAWEAGTSWAADGAVRWLLSGDAEAARLRRSAVFQVMPVFDIDGAAEGAVRFNANGFDNNRNWDTAEPGKMPEIFTVRKLLLGGRMDLFLALHNTESVDYVEGPVMDERVRPAAEALVKGLRERTSFVDGRSPRNSMGAAIDKGRYTVNQYLYAERKAPAFLMEMMVERHPRLGRPRTSRDFSALGEGLARSLWEAANAGK